MAEGSDAAGAGAGAGTPDAVQLHQRWLADMQVVLGQGKLRVHDLFNSYDRERRGFITRDDFKRGLMRSRNSGVNLTDGEISTLVKHMDKDADDRIDYFEFSAKLQYKHAKTPPPARKNKKKKKRRNSKKKVLMSTTGAVGTAGRQTQQPVEAGAADEDAADVSVDVSMDGGDEVASAASSAVASPQRDADEADSPPDAASGDAGSPDKAAESATDAANGDAAAPANGVEGDGDDAAQPSEVESPLASPEREATPSQAPDTASSPSPVKTVAQPDFGSPTPTKEPTQDPTLAESPKIVDAGYMAVGTPAEKARLASEQGGKAEYIAVGAEAAAPNPDARYWELDAPDNRRVTLL
eukprot:m.68401 g.68401  ORF g.68401 m.68401 type:complete len:354 (+) comp13902_c0_seq2:248-1309(+)